MADQWTPPSNRAWAVRPNPVRFQPARPRQTEECPRGHQLVGWNRKATGNNHVCRACATAFQWARRNRKFNDDPVVKARADASAAAFVLRDEFGG